MALFRSLKYKFIRIDKNKWLFSSFGGAYSDSPRAVSEFIHTNYPEIQIVWGVKNPENYDSIRDVRFVDINSEEFYFERASAKVIIDNVWANQAQLLKRQALIRNIKAIICQFLYKKRDQKFYSVWHGSPLKRIGHDQIGNDDIIGMTINKNFKMFVGDEHSLQVLKRVSFNKISILNTGLARNDVLFHNSDKSRIGITSNKKILLFAPTFRNDGKDVQDKNIDRSGLEQLRMIDFTMLFSCLKEKFGGDWVFICRFHYHVANMVDWDDLNMRYPGQIIDGNKYEDMADYLACADILITDVSSCMFDFALTMKPCFLLFHDYDNYVSKERGLYFNITKLPFPFAYDFNQLIENIKAFDQGKYTQDVRNLQAELGTADDGHATERITKQIIEENR